MPEVYYGMDAQEFERAKEIVRGDLDAEMIDVATCKAMLLQLEMMERIAMQMTRIANVLELFEAKRIQLHLNLEQEAKQ